MAYLAFMTFGLTFGSILFHARGDTSGSGFAKRPNEERCMEEEVIHPNHIWLFLCVPLYIAACNTYLKVNTITFSHILFALSVGKLIAK